MVIRIALETSMETKTRKELVNEYKQREPQMGVFQVRNTVNGKVFIGSSTTIDTVWNSQRMKLETNWHPNKALQTEWNELGADKFVFEVVEMLKASDNAAVDPKEELKVLEAMCLERVEESYNKR
jgi:hypothetical protein